MIIKVELVFCGIYDEVIPGGPLRNGLYLIITRVP